MDNIKDKLIQGNKIFIEAHNKEHYDSLINKQEPYALIISCSDSRVIPEKIFNVDAGELFVIRSAGNVVNDGELATIEYALEHLHIHYVLVLAHTSCGAVKASLEEEKGHYLNKIIDRITLNIKGIKDYDEAIKENAVKTKEFILDKFKDYSFEIETAIYDLKSRKVTFF